MRALAQAHGGKCLSDTYISITEKLTWQCAQGHVWESVPAGVKKGTWCRACYSERQKIGIEAMHALAEERGGRCLSEVYVDNRQALTWQCAKGHVWESAPGNLKKGKWCPFCFRERRRLGMEEMHALAHKHRGRCLSEKYVSTGHRLLWECAAGHRWASTPAKVKRGSWCLECFQKRRRLGIEAARQLAREQGGECLSDTYLHTEQRLRWRCREGHVWERSLQSMQVMLKKGLPWCSRCRREKEQRQRLDALHALARARGGECLSSQYLTNDKKLIWRCAKGHVWQATTQGVEVMGYWCPECARQVQMSTLADMQAAAHERGGNCLSEKYINSRSKLWWECKRGHRWQAVPGSVICKNTWCPQCAILERCKYEKSRRKYLPDGAVPSR